MKLNMEYEHDKLDTALESRAMTIDILAGEIKRKNQHIKYWREKAEYHRDHAVKFQKEYEEARSDWLNLDSLCDEKVFKIRALEKELKKHKLANKITTERKRITNGHAKEFKK